MAEYKRPPLPYTPPEVLPYNDRYALIAEENQPIGSKELDGEMNYVIACLNALFVFIGTVAAGNLPGAGEETNVNKFPVTDGDNNITWSKILETHFSNQCIPTEALKPGCVTTGVIGNGSITADKLQAGAPNNTNINDNSISFDKITNANNVNFQNFFNSQTNGTLNGSKITDNSVSGSKIIDSSIETEKINDGAVTTSKIANNSITTTKLAMTAQLPLATIIDWAGGGLAPAGWLKANGQSISVAIYAALFAAIGYTYGGAGDNFNVPDLRGRGTFGVDPASMQPTGNRIADNTTIASSGGEEKHTLTLPEIPVHTHSVVNLPFAANAASGGDVGCYQPSGTVQTGSAGGGGSHNNMPPYMLVQKIIYAGV